MSEQQGEKCVQERAVTPPKKKLKKGTKGLIDSVLPARLPVFAAVEVATGDTEAANDTFQESTMQYSEAKRSFLDDIREQVLDGHKRQTTHTTYQSWLNRYGRWLETNDQGDPAIGDALATALIRRFFHELRDQHKNSATTRRSCWGVLDQFCKFVSRDRLIRQNPMQFIERPKKSAATRKVANEEDVAALMLAAERQMRPFDSARSTALLATLAYAGLRAFEVAAMRVGDVDFKSKTLTVPDGKGGTSEVMHPHPQFFDALKAWMVERDKIGCLHDSLWAHDRRRGISDDWLRTHLRDLKARAGLDEDAAITPHCWRRWMARRIMHEGADLRDVQKALRHKDSRTTHTYIQADDRNARNLAKYGGFDPKAVVTRVAGENSDLHHELQASPRRNAAEAQQPRQSAVATRYSEASQDRRSPRRRIVR